MSKFEKHPNGGRNELLNADDFYVSYNPSPCSGMGFLRGDRGSDETALAVANGQPDGGTLWLILNGDYRREYEEAFQRGLPACIAVYEAHRAVARSSWSTDGVGDGDVLDWLKNRLEAVAPTAANGEEGAP